MKNKLIALLLALALSVTALNAATGTAAIGQRVTFSVSVSTGTPPFTYQWKKNGVNIAGATAATYVIPAISTGDVGTYTVAVTNPAGSTTSDDGIFTLTVAPGSAVVTITVTVTVTP